MYNGPKNTEGVDEICFDVVDTGEGMTNEEKNSLFDCFGTSQANRIGSGIGMTVSNILAKKLGGQGL